MFPFMEKEYIFTKDVYFECFCYSEKMPKCVQSTLYGEMKRHCEKSVLRDFLSFKVTKTVKRMNSILYGRKGSTLPKRVFEFISHY